MQTLPVEALCPKSVSPDLGVISVFITNLGRYNEGELVGEWLSLPTSQEELANCLKRIGIDGVNYEEYFLTDYESTVDGVSSYISQYSNLNELNYLAYQLEELTNVEIELYEAIIYIGEYVQSLADLINLPDNLDCFQCLWDVKDEYDLGYYWIDESGCYSTKELGNLMNYFDYERYGHDIALEQGGTFASCGYVYHTGESFIESYDGKNIPEEYCVS
ncbi:antirestriction protein ArdA [Orbus sasakiae]|uniref:Antirestriction protein ArdA n=1 Tax=Orbus sasakiae TaxID=1078475 RepID=A0ABP9N8I8_9GAMM